jgi:hypothetical protein
MFRRIPVGVIFGFLVVLLFACDDHDEFRDDVVLCEDAVAHLTQCCGTRPSISCHYEYLADAPDDAAEEDDGDPGVMGGCNSRTTRPDLSVTSSRQILATSCADLAKECSQ